MFLSFFFLAYSYSFLFSFPKQLLKARMGSWEAFYCIKSEQREEMLRQTAEMFLECCAFECMGRLYSFSKQRMRQRVRNTWKSSVPYVLYMCVLFFPFSTSISICRKFKCLQRSFKSTTNVTHFRFWKQINLADKYFSCSCYMFPTVLRVKMLIVD